MSKHTTWPQVCGHVDGTSIRPVARKDGNTEEKLNYKLNYWRLR